MKQADSLQSIHAGAGYVSLFTTCSETRLWFMGDGVVRARTSFGGAFPEESLSLVWTAWEDRFDAFLGGERTRTAPAAPAITEEPGRVLLQHGGLTVEVNRTPFALSFCFEGETQLRDVPGRAYLSTSGRILHSFCLDESNFYGFGEKTGALEKTGAAMRMSNKDACGYDPVSTDPLYKHIPYFIKLSPGGAACGAYYNLSADCAFDIGREYNGYWPRMGQFATEGDEVDLFFIAGPSMREVVRRFTKLTGRPSMLPAYALGYLGSTMYYSELPSGCDDAILGFVDKAQRYGLPCTGFHLSSGYTTDEEGKRNVFTWNHAKFPAPAGFVAGMQARGAAVTPNIKPGILLSHPRYAEFAEAGVFIRRKDGSPFIVQFWGGEGSLVDFSNPAGRALWQQMMEQALMQYGIQSVWNDNNEFDVMDENAICDNEGRPVPARSIRARLPMLMNIASKQALERAFPGVRLYQVTRSGNTGINRYAQTWAGDNSTSWASLRYNIATVLGSGLSGMANTGADVGGFAGPAPSPELFMRWVWYGVLQPRFSIHSANNDNTVTEPWMYPELVPLMQKAFALRQSLMPYLYSLMAAAHETGEPIMRPMVYEFQHDENCRREGVDFMLGSALLAACVTEPGAQTRSVYLPAGESFFDYYTRAFYPGGQTVQVACGLESTPLLLRSGSMLPLRLGGGIRVWASPGPNCRFTLYEDDGASNEYRQGGFLATQLSLVQRGTLLVLEAKQQGSYRPAEALGFEIQCRGQAPRGIAWNGHPLPQFLAQDDFDAASEGWHYSAGSRSCLVKRGNGRDLKHLEIDFGYFDLIRM